MNVPLIDTVGCNLFQKGDLTLTSTLAPKTQKLHCKNPIICIKPITENHETFSIKGLIKIFGEQGYILEYDIRRKMLKSKKNNENFGRHRDVIAQIEVKIVCEEDNLKKELKNLGLIFYKDQHNTNTTIQPYDNIIQTLHHIKVIRKSFNLKSTKYIQFFCNIVCKGVPAPLFSRHQPLDPACPLFKNLCFPLPHFYSIRF